MSRLTTKQAAQYLAENGVPYKASSLEVMRAQRRGPRFYKHGRKVFYDLVDLDAFIGLACPVETVDSIVSQEL
jgi:isopentenyl diphosphate isomerase/L-lactate dehydrogenase-like FMN-dependent dehydrogenase